MYEKLSLKRQNIKSTTPCLISSSIYIPASCVLIFNTFLFSDYITNSTPYRPANLLWIQSDSIIPSTPRSFLWSLSFALFYRNLVHFSLPQACHLSHTPNSPCFFCLMILGDEYKTQKLFIVQFPAFSCYFILFTLTGL
jgi:hypothetical protein